MVEGDQGDLTAVAGATAGAGALYWVNPPTDDDDPVAGHARTGEVAAAAVTENAVPRVVFQSSVGAEARHGFGEIDGLARTEELFDATGAHVTHLRCGYFFTNLLLDLEAVRSGVLSTTLPVDHRMPWVDPRDIGDVAAVRLLATDWTGRHTRGVHGPEDLSFAEVARIVGAAVGRPLTAVQVPETEVAAALRSIGFTDAQAEGVLGCPGGSGASPRRTCGISSARRPHRWAPGSTPCSGPRSRPEPPGTPPVSGPRCRAAPDQGTGSRRRSQVRTTWPPSNVLTSVRSNRAGENSPASKAGRPAPATTG